jgi:glutathione S-transferase
VGDKFTAADVYVGSILGFGMQFGVLDKRPEFEAYWTGLKDRPAAVRAAAQAEKLQSEHGGASAGRKSKR